MMNSYNTSHTQYFTLYFYSNCAGSIDNNVTFYGDRNNYFYKLEMHTKKGELENIIEHKGSD